METSCEQLRDDEIKLLRNIIKAFEGPDIRGFRNHGYKTEDDWTNSGEVKIPLETGSKGNFYSCHQCWH